MNKQILRNTIFVGLFLIPFIPFFVSSSLFFPFITTKAFAWRTVVEVVFAAWVLLALVSKEYRPKKSPILYATGAFLLVIGLANLFGVAPVKSFWSNFERMEGYVTLLHLGAYFLVVGSVFKERDWTRWWNTTLVASAFMVVYSVFQLLGAVTINQGGVRVDGTFGNAIYLAVYMLFHIFIALLLMVREWKNRSLRYMYGALIFLELVVLYFTATRGAILGLIGGLLVFAVLNVRNREEKTLRKLSIGVLCAVAVVVGGFFLVKDSSFVKESPVLNRFATLSMSELKTQGRYFVWPMAWEGFKERPLLGWGQENFNYVFQEHYRPEMYALEPWFDHAHNIYLDWMVTGGLLGILAYLSLYGLSLYLLWRKSNFSSVEKSVITALLASYFFHNFFVFDHLTSYVLFFSLLAYLHFRYEGVLFSEDEWTYSRMQTWAAPVVAIALLSTLYFVNWQPLKGNLAVIEAMKSLQTPGQQAEAVVAFEKAYQSSRLGRPEIVEQIATRATEILSSSEIPLEEKNAFHAFATEVVTSNEENLENDARHELIAGSYLTAVGDLDQGLEYLERAYKLMPTKQVILFEIGAAYINKKDPRTALLVFKQAYDLAPESMEARIIYLVGAIYAGDRALEGEMRALIDERNLNFDDRIMSAYYLNGRTDRVRAILNERKRLDPTNAATYDKYLSEVK